MPLYEFGCEKCKERRDAMLSYEEMLAARECKLKCPSCGDETGAYREIFTKAPLGRVGGPGSDRDIAAMQQSFREHFQKSGEADEVRHKHGSAFDDSIRGAAAEKIKQNLGTA